MLRSVENCEEFLTFEQRVMLRWAVREGRRRTRVAELALSLHVTERTLHRWCAGLSGLSTRDLLTLGRVLHAGCVMGRTTLSTASVAFLLQFPGSPESRARFRWVKGHDPTDLPREALFDMALHGFENALRAATGSTELNREIS